MMIYHVAKMFHIKGTYNYSQGALKIGKKRKKKKRKKKLTNACDVILEHGYRKLVYENLYY